MVLLRIIVGINKLYQSSQTFKKPLNTLCLCRNSFATSIERSNGGALAFKENLIASLNFQSSEDALPFYKLNTKTIIKVSKITKNDQNNGYCQNRLYYIASKIKCPPALLSEKLAKRIFVYQLSFDWLENSLNALLDMGVPGDRIVRDLWVLKYHHSTIRERLQYVKDSGIDHLFPWMVRCTPEILNKYISLFQETRSILGESKSAQMYIAERLNTSIEVVEEMYLRLPALKSIRIPKLKAFLDFLISEGFSVEDISSKSRILAASQKTVKQRLDMLRGLGISSINLNILCRSRKDFQKYVESVKNAKKENDADKEIQK